MKTLIEYKQLKWGPPTIHNSRFIFIISRAGKMPLKFKALQGLSRIMTDDSSAHTPLIYIVCNLSLRAQLAYAHLRSSAAITLFNWLLVL